ncbi:MAG: hypothetical protein LBJ15_19615 [Comamonas sp.]|jgi:hypothetical protein|uniref:hypothetical protein n=1 Tax=Comamonas sp. TaxID=34028 RepID=UPI00282F9FDF|nr:hypothetical protein [Comamonas sp.]MDR0216184.1 hypothetical protein [Comamonas sp.]
MAINDGYALFQGGYYRTSDMSGPYSIAEDGTVTLIGAGGGGGGSSGGLTNAQLRATAVDVRPIFTRGGNMELTTSATPGEYVVFDSQEIMQFTISNTSDHIIEVQRNGAGVGFEIDARHSFTFFSLRNANQIGVRRRDGDAGQIRLTACWES